MGWNNPPVSWAQLERALSGAPLPAESELWKWREAPTLPERVPGPVVPYAELHVHSHYSFLDGASSPEQLVAEATRLGLHGIGLTDHDGLYGIVRMAEAAEVSTLKTVFGAELSLGLSRPQNGEPDPEGDHLVVMARREEGYHRLAGAITTAQLDTDAEKGRPVYDLDVLAAAASGHWLVLTGCRKGAVRRALVSEGADAAARRAASRTGVMTAFHRRAPASGRPVGSAVAGVAVLGNVRLVLVPLVLAVILVGLGVLLAVASVAVGVGARRVRAGAVPADLWGGGLGGRLGWVDARSLDGAQARAPVVGCQGIGPAARPRRS